MSGTTWAVTKDGKPLTWTRLHELWEGRERVVGEPLPGTELNRLKSLTAVCPVQFDVADELRSAQAQELLLWITSWLGKTGHGIRLVPSIPTASVAERAPGRLAGKPIRI